MKLETKRLFLREMTPEDFDALYAVLADSDIVRHYPYTFDEARVKNWINKNTERYRVFGFGLWAVCLQSTAEMIGDCGLTMQNIEKNGGGPKNNIRTATIIFLSLSTARSESFPAAERSWRERTKPCLSTA